MDMVEDCQVCAGLGWVDVGNCEDGVIQFCPGCGGTGQEHYRQYKLQKSHKEAAQ